MKTCGNCLFAKPDAPDLLRCHCGKSKFKGCTTDPDSKGCDVWEGKK